MGPEIMMWLCLGTSALLAWLCIVSDAREARLVGMHVDGVAADAVRIVVASAWGNRRVGLLNQAGLERRSGLLLRGCCCVHTRGMLFSIDVVLLDARDCVLEIHAGVLPGAVVRGPRGTRSVLELASGAALSEFALRPGAQLVFRPVAWPKVRTEFRTVGIRG